MSPLESAAMTSEAPIEGLLDSDPALRWQVERDVLHEPAEVWEATRARIATEGWVITLSPNRIRMGNGQEARSSQQTTTATGPRPTACQRDANWTFR